MFGLKVEICEYIDDAQPGWVKYRSVDAYDKECLFVEKAPVVSDVRLDANSSFPQPGIIGCVMMKRTVKGQREIIAVDTSLPWGIKSTNGDNLFDVFPEQVSEFERWK